MKFEQLGVAALLWSLGSSFAMANTPGSGLPAIDTTVLDNTRLFFNEAQRQLAGVGNDHGINTGASNGEGDNKGGAKNHTNSSARKPPSIRPESDSVLSYTGIVQSVRGTQLLINGVPWRPWQQAVVSARVQIDTQLLEIDLENGKQYQLLPGESVKVKP